MIDKKKNHSHLLHLDMDMEFILNKLHASLSEYR